jgi:putative transposase
MANTYTQIHIQAIFAVQNRQSLIQKEWREELYKYITGIVQNNNHKVLQINGMPDHIHLFFGMRPSQSLSDLMKVVKGDSSEWINKKKFTKGKFSWQSGYGLSPMPNHKCQESFDTFKTRKSITQRSLLKKNTLIF